MKEKNKSIGHKSRKSKHSDNINKSSLKKSKRHRSSSSSSSTSSSSDSSHENKKKHFRKRKKSSSSSSSSDSLDEKRKRKKKKIKNKKRTKSSTDTNKHESEVSMDIPLDLMNNTSKNMAPMTKEDWEKQRSVVKRVYDESTGRHRLVRGDGEIVEEIVSKERHRQINKTATKGDGDYFQIKLAKIN